MKSVLYIILVFLALMPLNTYGDSDPYPGVACIECHDDKLSKSELHEPAVDDCTNCHAVHGTDTGYPYRLYNKGNQVCLACHTNSQDPSVNAEAHPTGGHPVFGNKDPLYKDREFGCVSCHNPHGSDMPKLFRYDFRKDVTPYMGESCAVCHYQIYFGNSKPIPPTPPWEQ